MQQPLIISIVGQTATGKTDLAFSLAERLLRDGRQRVDILSADSRQVYKGLEVLSGADVPPMFTQIYNTFPFLPRFEDPYGRIRLHGVGCIPPNFEWSVSQFHHLFQSLLQHQTSETALIIVGGTGLYHQQIFAPADTLGVKPDPALRAQLETLELGELQKKLQTLWPERWENMNDSDRQNPRRLIRAIEVAQSQAPASQPMPLSQPQHQIGLFLPTETLTEKIRTRIDKRWEKAVQEVRLLEGRFPKKPLPSKTILGYKQIFEHLFENLSEEEAKNLWLTAELQYAKRQYTWWKKQPDIAWYPADTPPLVL